MAVEDEPDALFPGAELQHSRRMFVARLFRHPAVHEKSCGLQVEPGDSGNDIESGLTFQAHRLEGERVVEAAHERVCVAADANRRARSCTRIVALQRAMAKV